MLFEILAFHQMSVFPFPECLILISLSEMSNSWWVSDLRGRQAGESGALAWFGPVTASEC